MEKKRKDMISKIKKNKELLERYNNNPNDENLKAVRDYETFVYQKAQNTLSYIANYEKMKKSMKK